MASTELTGGNPQQDQDPPADGQMKGGRERNGGGQKEEPDNVRIEFDFCGLVNGLSFWQKNLATS